MLTRYRVLIEPVQFDDLKTVVVVEYPPLLQALAPLPSEAEINRAGLLRMIKVPFDSGKLARAVIGAQQADWNRLPRWEFDQRQATEIRLVLPLPALAPAEERELLALYAPALVEITEHGLFFGDDALPILGVDARQQSLLDAATRPGLEALHLRRLIDAGTRWDYSLLEDELRELTDPLPYLEGLRPFFEKGHGDITAENGYPRLRNFYKLMERNKEGLAALGALPAWRAAFNRFEELHGYSACPADWGRSGLISRVKTVLGMSGRKTATSKPWPIATPEGLKAYENSLPKSFR